MPGPEPRAATAEEAFAVRDDVLQRIAALEPEVARLRKVQRDLNKSYKQAHLEWVTADIALRRYRRYLFALAAGAASGTLVWHDRA